jgi:serine/threonine protein kinase
MSIPQNLCGNCFKAREVTEGSCPFCGYDRTENEEKYPLALRGGSVLAGQYIVGHVLGQGGFGITYLAFDHLLGIKVAIKEFMPEGMGTRLPGTTQVTVYAGERQDYFNYGAERFLEEARVLAKFIGNRNIAGVKNFFIENNTSYFVMDYIEGISFKNHIKNCGGKIGYEEALRILVPVLRALADVHREGLIHRDVTPDNIIISKDGEVKLLDFGSARYNLGDKSKSLDVILKAGYAPKEQYLRHGKQGSWTDVYSVAACFYFSITGNLPPEALERMEEDELAEFFAYGIKLPAYLNEAIMKGLEINANDRFQSASEFLQAIEEGQKCEEEEKNLRDEDMWNQNPDESKQMPLYIPTVVSVPSQESYVAASPQNVSARFTPISLPVKRLTMKKILAAVGSAAAILLIAVIVYRFIYDIKQYQDTLSLLDDGTDVNVESGTELNNESDLSESGSSDSTNDEGIIENSDGTNDEGIIGNSEENLEKISTLYIGQRDVPFGAYMWRVLDIQDGKALIISEDIVSERVLNQKDEAYVWENCDLRNYLNETFLQSFTQEEQNAIVEVTNNNKANEWAYYGGGEDTIDKIFLLSLEEVINYFGDSGQLDDYTSVADRFLDQYCGARKADDGHGWSIWWLRSPSWNVANFVTHVDHDGAISLSGSDADTSLGVRPALWIDISSYDFRESVLPTNLSIGQRDVLYGEYTWRVLDMQDGNALLLSEEIIEERAYHNEYEDCTWENCDLRKYLNESFINSFTQEEQDVMVEVSNSNDDNQWYYIEGGEDTKDKVFLLSLKEVADYFGDSGQLGINNDIWRIYDQYNQARKAKYGNESMWWWLRSPGISDTNAAYVLSNGVLDVGGSNIDDAEGGVRPALWIKVDQ